MKNKIKKINKGFTLIEVMIAITLFSVIMIIGSGAVLRTNATYKKTQTLRSVMDNLSFIMEDMARNLRLGSNFQCPLSGSVTIPVTTPVSPSDCPANNSSIAFNSVDGSVIVYGIAQNLGGVTDQSGNIILSIFKYKGTGSVDPLQLTPNEVQIDSNRSGFTVIGSDPADMVQPRVVIRLAGTVTYKADLKSSFNLETTVSQRLLDR